MSYQVTATPQGDVLQIKLTGEIEGHADDIVYVRTNHARHDKPTLQYQAVISAG